MELLILIISGILIILTPVVTYLLIVIDNLKRRLNEVEDRLEDIYPTLS